MEEYLAACPQNAPIPCWGVFSRLKSLLDKLFAKISGHAEEDRETQRPVSQALIHEQAERMLHDHGNAVLRIAYSYLHNKADAEEILQETLVKFLKAVPKLESREHEKAWLLRVAANLSKDRIKYNSLRKTDELMEELAAEEPDDLSFVWDGVRSLPVKYREVIYLFYYEGYSAAEISSLTGMKESTVRSNLTRGRKMLRTILGGGVQL